MATLTDKQKAVLAFIVSFREKFGYSPTTREIRDHFGWAGQTSAVNHVKALVRKGVVTFVPTKQRTIVPV